jgi:hypothetical protein
MCVLALVVSLTACSNTTSGDGQRSTGPGPTSPGPTSTGATSTGTTSTGATSTDTTAAPGTTPAARARYLSELPEAAAIPGVTFKPEPDRNHVPGVLRYDSAPPVGGNHSQYWADCTGTVYPDAIANENAVHALEHGAVWITYRAGLARADLDGLTKWVRGEDRMLMSPYPGLKTAISLQSWGYQLAVDSASDPRIQRFIDAVRYNEQTTPEFGATCSDPAFKQHPSTFGHPLWAPAG